jgi:hypothetical protein
MSLRFLVSSYRFSVQLRDAEVDRPTKEKPFRHLNRNSQRQQRLVLILPSLFFVFFASFCLISLF